MTDPTPALLAYDELDDATLAPATVRLVDGILSIDGFVRADGILVPLAPGVGRRSRVPVVLRIEPVTAWRFSGLDRGTGELLAGDFRADDRGGRVVGVIPGDLVVESPSRPRAWFEVGAVAETGRSPAVRPAAPPVGLTRERRHGLVLGAIGVLGGFLAFLAFFGLTIGIAAWDWNGDSPLTVYFDRGRDWPIRFEHAWHYLVPLLVAEAAGIAAFFVGILGSINPKRS